VRVQRGFSGLGLTPRTSCGDFPSRFGDNTISVTLAAVPWREEAPHFGARHVVPDKTAPFKTKQAGFAAFSFEVVGMTEFESPVRVRP
jgi:hypothetical protein